MNGKVKKAASEMPSLTRSARQNEPGRRAVAGSELYDQIATCELLIRQHVIQTGDKSVMRRLRVLRGLMMWLPMTPKSVVPLPPLEIADLIAIGAEIEQGDPKEISREDVYNKMGIPPSGDAPSSPTKKWWQIWT